MSKEEAQFGGTNSRSTMSRTDQLRYEQLHKENVELKRQIDIVSCDSSSLRDRLPNLIHGPSVEPPFVAMTCTSSLFQTARRTKRINNVLFSAAQNVLRAGLGTVCRPMSNDPKFNAYPISRYQRNDGHSMPILMRAQQKSALNFRTKFYVYPILGLVLADILVCS